MCEHYKPNEIEMKIKVPVKQISIIITNSSFKL